jgi:TRAP-type transport system periplasmic protein
MKLILYRLVVIFSVVLLISAMHLTVCASEPGQRVLKFANPFPSTGVYPKIMQWMASEITKRTNDKLKFEFYWSASLLPNQDQVHGVGKGIADIANVSSTFTQTENPHWTTLSTGLASDLWVAVWASWDVLQNSPEIKAEMDKLNLVPTHGYTAGSNYWIFKNRLETLQDLKGKRIRTYGVKPTKIFQALGATPVTIGPGEMYESIERGVINGAQGGLILGSTFKLYEVAKYFAVPSPLKETLDITVVINKDVWKSFDQKTRDIIDEVSREVNDRYVQAVMEEEQRLKKEMSTKYGVVFYDMAPEVQAAYIKAGEAFDADWFNKWDPQGKKTKVVSEEIKKSIAKWEKVLKEKGYPWKR